MAGFLAGAVGLPSAEAEFDAEEYLLFEVGGVSLRPQLEVAETYDSNVFYDETDLVDDFITSIRPGMSLVYGDREDNFVSVRYTLDASIYADRTDLNNLGHILQHQSRYAFSRLVLQANDQLSFTETLLGGSFSYIQQRIGQVSLQDDWRADYEISPRTVVGLKLGFTLLDYDAGDFPDDNRVLYDYMIYSAGFRVGYRPSEKITLFPEFSAGQSFLTENSSRQPEAPDLTSYGVSFGAEGQFTPKLTGVVAGGYEMRNYSDGEEIPDGWVATVQLRWQARAKTMVLVGYRHWVQVSREAVGLSYSAHRPTVSIRQEFGTQGRWSATLDGYYQFDDYDNAFIVNGESIQRQDNLGGVALRASYRWKPWLTASAGYDFIHFDENIPTIPNYDVHRFSLRLLAGY